MKRLLTGRLEPAAVTTLLCLFAVQCLTSMRVKGITYDETTYYGIGKDILEEEVLGVVKEMFDAQEKSTKIMTEAFSGTLRTVIQELGDLTTSVGELAAGVREMAEKVVKIEKTWCGS